MVAMLTTAILPASAALGSSPSIGTITEFTVPTPGSDMSEIAAGPDGSLWFTEFLGDKIGRITPNGTVKEFPMSSPATPDHIAAGPDGNLWFTDGNHDHVGRITPMGTVTLFPLTSGSFPIGITAGPDGNMWFTEGDRNRIAKITTSAPNTITEYVVPTNSANVFGIAPGPDGNLWFSEQFASKIGRVTTGGTMTEFPLATNSWPFDISAGPDGNVWFAENQGNRIGRISPVSPNAITEFSTTGSPYGIAAGPDGNLWFTEQFGNKIGQITPSGTITQFSIPTTNAQATGITIGPDGNLWFVEQQGNKIGRLSDASANTSYALVWSYVFVPSKVRVATQGTTVQWAVLGPVNHTVTDSSGMRLFDSGSVSFITYFTFVFSAAGKYSYQCTNHPTLMNGAVSVPIVVPATGTIGTPFTVTWASAGPPTSDYVFDAQVKIPGATRWSNWQRGVTTLSAQYTPSLGGTYQFRARLRNMALGKASAYSAPGKVIVT